MTEKITQPANYYYNAYFSKKNITHLIHKKRIDRVAALIPPKSKVLDVGCGSGVLGLLLLKKGCDVTGLDLRQECVDFASTVAPEGEFIQGDLLDFNLKRQFDFVICMEVIEHFNEESRHKVISNLDKHVKTGGSLIFAFPSRNYQSIEGLWKLLRKLIYPKIVFDDEEIHETLNVYEFCEHLKENKYEIVEKSTDFIYLIEVIHARKRHS